MRLKTILFLGAFFLIANSYSQQSDIALTFSALDSVSYVKLDSIKIINRSQGDQNMLFWPDTTIILSINPGDTMLYIGYAAYEIVGIQDPEQQGSAFQVLQNRPNPVKDKSIVSLLIPEPGNIDIIISDIQGRIAYSNSYQLQSGEQNFLFQPGSESMYFFTAQWKGISSSIKILSLQQGIGRRCELKHIGNSPVLIQEKFATLSGGSVITKESGILDAPEESKTYTFQFMDNGPCPGTPTVTYGGQVYNTVQILSQCWLMENLNIGDMVSGDVEMTDNGIIEKYCYNNEPDSCESMGGLYLWDEMMQYISVQGVQGICPPGWHIPTDDEWKLLEGGVDSQYGIGDPEWDISQYYRGFDAGNKLKASFGWHNGGIGSDESGFQALPGGVRWHDGINYFHTGGSFGNWWSSSQFNTFMAWIRSLGYDEQEIHRMPSGKDLGYSVRCVKDN